jgi:hypothetical protein
METYAGAEVLATFRRYAHAFQSLDPKAVARHFHKPLLLITPHGVEALRAISDVEQVYARLMADLPAQGYAGTEFSSLAEQRLSDDLAIVSGAGVRKKATGEAFAPCGMTYTLRRAESAWLIAVATIARTRRDSATYEPHLLQPASHTFRLRSTTR